MSNALARGLVIAAVAVGVGAALWWLFPSDARRIRAASQELARLVSVPSGEPAESRLIRSVQIAKHLALGIVIEAEGIDERIEGRETVVGYVARMMSQRPLTVVLGEITVQMADDHRSAVATTEATVRERDVRAELDTIEKRNLQLGWASTDEGWQLSHIMVGPSLQSDGNR